MIAIFLATIGFFIAAIGVYSKSIRTDLEFKVDTEMKSGISNFINDLLESHVDIVTITDPSTHKQEFEPKLKENFDLDNIQESILDLIGKKKNQLRIQQRIKYFERLQDIFVLFLIPKIFTFLYLFLWDNVLKNIQGWRIIVTLKSITEHQIVFLDNLLTAVLLLIFIIMLIILVELLKFKRL